MEYKVAVLYQAVAAPKVDGIVKPMKDGGYSDSGADIAYALKKQNIDVVTPVNEPELSMDLDWVFPDTVEGIQSAIDKGATIVWLNTVLYQGHPIESFIARGVAVVGQVPKNVGLYDDKLVTNALLSAHHLPIPKSVVIAHKDANNFKIVFPFPVVAKPIRGRGSQGVSLARDMRELTNALSEMFGEGNFGGALYVEEFLSGQELTITVMPPGVYKINHVAILKESYWSLPPVRRFNHENGIAPYNGTVAVIHNSEVLSDTEMAQEKVKQLCGFCEQAAILVEAKAPIRIDCRADANGKFYLFDLNMKPNMTGASRPHRAEQDSLTALAARKIGWTFPDLLLNMLNQHWSGLSLDK